MRLIHNIRMMAATVMALGGLCANAATNTFDIGDLRYTITYAATATRTGEVSVQAVPNANPNDIPPISGDVVVPDTVTNEGLNYTVKSVPNQAFFNGYGITSMTLPATVTKIGEYAFYACKNMTSCPLPTKLKTLGEHAFYFCEGLQSVVVPVTVTEIPKSAFEHCTSLASITLGARTLKIGSFAFSHNDALEHIEFPATVKEMSGCLSYCTKLNNVVIPAKVLVVGSYMFEGCTSLTNVTLHDDINQILAYAFKGCTALEHIQLPAKLNWIGMNTFDGCTALKELVLPDGVANIFQQAFMNCSSLTEFTLPAHSGTPDASAFEGCTSLREITYEAQSAKIPYIAEGYRLDRIILGTGVTNVYPETTHLVRDETDEVDHSLIPVPVTHGSYVTTIQALPGTQETAVLGFATPVAYYEPTSLVMGRVINEPATSLDGATTVTDLTLDGVYCTTSGDDYAPLTNLQEVSLATNDTPISGHWSQNLRCIHTYYMNPPPCPAQFTQTTYETCRLDIPDPDSVPAYKAAEGWKLFFGPVSAIDDISDISDHSDMPTYDLQGRPASHGLLITRDGRKVLR